MICRVLLVSSSLGVVFPPSSVFPSLSLTCPFPASLHLHRIPSLVCVCLVFVPVCSLICTLHFLLSSFVATLSFWLSFILPGFLFFLCLSTFLPPSCFLCVVFHSCPHLVCQTVTQTDISFHLSSLNLMNHFLGHYFCSRRFIFIWAVSVIEDVLISQRSHRFTHPDVLAHWFHPSLLLCVYWMIITPVK